MKKINEVVEKKNGKYPEKVLQFGEGNFLRAFVDWMIDEANDEGLFGGSIVLCQPIAQGMVARLNAQDNVYTLVMRGLEKGKKTENVKVITSVSRGVNPYEEYDSYIALAKSKDLKVIVSNTTEAGISYGEGDKLDDRPPTSYPAKICSFLYTRYKHFNGDPALGILLLPVELIEDNGPVLKRIVYQYAKEWNLGDGFTKWLDSSCTFANTLVDRIVTGYPRNEAAEYEEKFGYKDDMIDTSEVFNLWVIEANKKYSDMFPIAKTQANVIWTDDVKPYKMRKVRILNGAHTSTVLAAYLSGYEYVGQFVKDEDFEAYLKDLIFSEVIPTIKLPKDELAQFASAVFERFGNPFINHRLLDISLNSVSKFVARCLPSLEDYLSIEKKLPSHLTFSLAALIKFYDVKHNEEGYYGIRENGDTYSVKDNAENLAFFEEAWKEKDLAKLVRNVLSSKTLWQRDLTEIEGLYKEVLVNLESIQKNGVRVTIKNL
ncbi:tagaturonate reductase [uncultured Sphaerochaeta sp.]|uniref:tagaturonate reductase n=1 Tax=uncultured Sphaerochaeta sp. TaxID=886478 RepID=UPI002A0A3A41|nr:tagaturonate reductase [uncultured Sphaerochaeta sp.]